MNNQLLRNLFPGLLPIFIFILADWLWGTLVGLYVACGVAAIELLVVYVKTRKIEKFVLVDLGLILVLAAASISSENDLWFKFKPAVLEIILLVILLVSAFGKKNLLLLMSKRYLKNLSFTEAQLEHSRMMMKQLSFITAVHIALVIYTAMYSSNEAWAFVSGVLFYILIAALFLFQFLKQKYFQKPTPDLTNHIPVVDEEGKVIGSADKDVCHSGQKYLHPVVHLHVLNKRQEILLQLRPSWKKIQPDKWDTAVGGHVELNETIEEALKRECGEEIGLELKDFNFVRKYVWESEVEKELVFCFYCIHEGPFDYSRDELSDLRFFSFADLKKMQSKNKLTPNFIHELENIFQTEPSR